MYVDSKAKTSFIKIRLGMSMIPHHRGGIFQQVYMCLVTRIYSTAHTGTDTNTFIGQEQVNVQNNPPFEHTNDTWYFCPQRQYMESTDRSLPSLHRI